MSTAHIFYLPIIFVVGLLAGYFIGRVQADNELAERRKRARRRAAAERLNAERQEANAAAAEEWPSIESESVDESLT